MSERPALDSQKSEQSDQQREQLIQEARALLRQTTLGALATLRDHAPFTTLVTLAPDHDGSPILFLSRLAHHTRNLEQDPRCSLLLARSGKGDPLAHPRLTIIGQAKPSQAPHLRALYLAANPKAQLYIDFPDFRFFRLEITGFHLNGGFARAAEFTADDVLSRP